MEQRVMQQQVLTDMKIKCILQEVKKDLFMSVHACAGKLAVQSKSLGYIITFWPTLNPLTNGLFTNDLKMVLKATHVKTSMAGNACI